MYGHQTVLLYTLFAGIYELNNCFAGLKDYFVGYFVGCFVFYWTGGKRSNCYPQQKLTHMASKSLIKPKEVREVMGVARSATCPDKRLTTTRTR